MLLMSFICEPTHAAQASQCLPLQLLPTLLSFLRRCRRRRPKAAQHGGDKAPRLEWPGVQGGALPTPATAMMRGATAGGNEGPRRLHHLGAGWRPLTWLQRLLPPVVVGQVGI
jgi:hypothetical protein